MGIVSGFVLYICIWMIVWFAVLPWRVHVPETSEPGFADSAPEKPHLLIKFIVTSLITFMIWLFFAFGFHKDLIQFDN